MRHLVGVFVALHLLTICLGSFGRYEVGGGLWLDAVHQTASLRRSYGSYLGPKQGWAMFSAVGHATGRTQIEVLEDGRWRPIYIERSPHADWRRRTFDHYRWRETFLMTSLDRHQRLFATTGDWLVAEVLRTHPEAKGARVRRMRAKLLTAEEIREGEVLAFDELVRRRGRHR
ncbi:MAG: hypothetical protein EP330_08075 [Deltaproteobacteria bacterium]|nr:MAG: hypothetical protein EP330_08075 [Deltaproteobacteria bacterium]